MKEKTIKKIYRIADAGNLNLMRVEEFLDVKELKDYYFTSDSTYLLKNSDNIFFSEVEARQKMIFHYDKMIKSINRYIQFEQEKIKELNKSVQKMDKSA